MRNNLSCKTPRKKINLLPEDPVHIDEYNVKIKESIANWQQNNENPSIDQPSLIPILQEASKTFPEETPSKNDWFSKDEKNLLKLVAERNENERKLRLDKNTEHFKIACKKSRKALKKAIKTRK